MHGHVLLTFRACLEGAAASAAGARALQLVATTHLLCNGMRQMSHEKLNDKIIKTSRQAHYTHHSWHSKLYPGRYKQVGSGTECTADLGMRMLA